MKNPYAGHADFYLLDVWQRRDELDDVERSALRAEMKSRGLDFDPPETAGAPYRNAASGPVGGPCPVCGRPMRAGDVSVHREPGMGLIAHQGLATHLYFRRRGGDETIVFRHTETRPGAMCEDCGSVVVRGCFADE
jgi:hypothetical protein